MTFDDFPPLEVLRAMELVRAARDEDDAAIDRTLAGLSAIEIAKVAAEAVRLASGHAAVNEGPVAEVGQEPRPRRRMVLRPPVAPFPDVSTSS